MAAPAPAAEHPRFEIFGQVYALGAPGLQDVLAQAHDTGHRPRCQCTTPGVEMYVARHGRYLVKRMPGTGERHHPQCPSFEPEAAQSGLGELVGEAVLEPEPGCIELCVDFPWTRLVHGGHARTEPDGDPGEVRVAHRRMSLRAVTHYLFERAGFNRWTPGMAGKRHQGVVHKYLLEAAAGISIKGVPFADRLYVPEPFREDTRQAVAQRRREKLAFLRQGHDTQPLALVLGEFKQVEPAGSDVRIRIRHMPDAPLWAERRLWQRLQRAYASVLEARDADAGMRVRVVLTALVRARNEFAYAIDAASLMLTSEQWIPIEGVHELPLVDALVAARRRFLKPLRYDAGVAGGFANALLLDTGSRATPLHVVSLFLPSKEQAAKRAAIVGADSRPWVWQTGKPLPPLPPAASA